MRLGAHQSIQGGLAQSLYRGKAATCDTVQLFTAPPRRWQAPPLRDRDLEAFACARQATGMQVACAHASYLINLASPVASVRERSLQALRQELERCQQLAIPALVLHPGAHGGAGAEEAMEHAARGIDLALAARPHDTVVVCLETMSGQGSQLGDTCEQLATIAERVEDRARVGFCLDTAHVFAAGQAWAPWPDYQRLLRHVDATLGLERLRVVHLNDSARPRGARVDRHAHVGEGEIGLEAFGYLLNDPRLRHLPFILETPKGDDLVEDVVSLALLRSLLSPSPVPRALLPQHRPAVRLRGGKPSPSVS